MATGKRVSRRSVPPGGSPPRGGRAQGGTGAKRGKKPDPSPGKKGQSTLKERLAAVEAYWKSGLTQIQFAKVWGIHPVTLGNWVRKHAKEGPKALERKPHAGLGRRRLAHSLLEEIKKAKRTFPDFGLKKLKDHLYRFQGLKVSPGSIAKTLREDPARGAPAPSPKKQKPKKKAPRRFERSKPGSLWQSDITSFVLPRHQSRVYLTVFLDDYSRYIVSFALALHQKQELVTEALLSGIDRFGKPKEVLTDQGRQYFSWRGKSVFQKLLEKQGIQHVVARSHHPQTVGKCERFWKTVNEEFWSRVQPQELAEARERLSHFITHYNHHRPHQGIDGLVPADRFFGAESEVRAALEARQEKNALRLALGETPRRPVYLVGRIGDREVSLHGERGQLLIHTGDGGVEGMDPEELGMACKEQSDVRAQEGGEQGARPVSSPSEGAVCAAEAGAVTGESAVGCGGSRGEGAGPSGGGGDPGALAGPDEPRRGGEASGDAAASDLAALAAGALGPGGGPSDPAQGAQGEPGGSPGGEPLETEGENRQAGAGGGELEKPGGSVKGLSGAPGGPGGQGGGSWPGEEEVALRESEEGKSEEG
jgi:transposase InsO family protein